jgi:hypothetical protein
VAEDPFPDNGTRDFVAQSKSSPQSEPAAGGSLADRVRAICRVFPEVTERLSHGAPTWFVRDRAAFAALWEHGHHQYDFPHLVCAAPAGAQEALVASAPQRYFRPPYVGGRGWVGVRLDGDPDWDEIAELCEDAYRTVAPPRLVARLDAGG